MRKEIWRTAAGPPQAKESATCDSSFTQKILVMKPESFSAILKERLLHPVLVEPADECDVRLQLNSREKTEKRRREVEGTIRKPSGGRTMRKRSGQTKQIENPHFTGGKVKQNHKIVNIPITKLAKKTAKKHGEVVDILKIGQFS